MADLTRLGDGVNRAVQALFRGVGGRSVQLRLPRPAAEGAVGEQLGLAVAAFDDVALAPAVLRRLRGAGAKGVRARYELLLTARAVAMVAGDGTASALALFAMAAGVMVDGAWLRISDVSCRDLSGVVYLYRLELEAAETDEI